MARIHEHAATSHFDDDMIRDWLRLARTPHVGPITFYRLLQKFGTARAAAGDVWNAGITIITLEIRRQGSGRALDQFMTDVAGTPASRCCSSPPPAATPRRSSAGR